MVCNICGKEMHESISDKKFQNGSKGVSVQNVLVYRCECGNLVYGSNILKMIDNFHKKGDGFL